MIDTSTDYVFVPSYTSELRIFIMVVVCHRIKD